MLMNYLTDWTSSLFSAWGLNSSKAGILEHIVIFLLIVLISYLAYFIAKRILVNGISKITRKTKAVWDDYVFNEKILRSLSHIVPAVVLYALLPLAFQSYPELLAFTLKICMVYIIAVSLRFVNAFLVVVFDVVSSTKAFKGRSLKGFLQVFQLIVIFVGIILIVSIVIDKSPVTLFAGLGASAAILTLVFKDSLVGLIAGVQLTANDMVRVGDWIEMPKNGVDGDVIEITLNTVKVRNFDKTIVTVPPSALVSDAFKNWRGMAESGGRRIKRSVNIDMNSVKFCTPEMLEKYHKIEFLKEYIEQKEREIDTFNKERDVDVTISVNGRRQTNLGVFRAYLEMYLSNNPGVNHEMTHMVRQLQPTDHGIPLELYFFSADNRWIPYESFQADVFDHVLAIIPEFDLRVYQSPSGADFSRPIQNV